MASHAPHKNLLVVKLPRTGSTYLGHLLRQHQRISFYGEYLNPHANRRAQLMQGPLGLPGIRRLTGMVLRRAKWRDLATLLASATETNIVGASINPFKEQLTEPDLRRVVNAGTRVIVLSRENLLKQHISHLNVMAEREAGTERPYKSYNDHGRPTERTFVIGPDAVAKIELLDRQREALLAMVASLDAPQLYLTYEQHINVPDKGPLLVELAEFLDVDIAAEWEPDARPQRNVPRFHKLVSDDLRDVIENYDEIAANPALAKFL